jgi:hypothetical protein
LKGDHWPNLQRKNRETEGKEIERQLHNITAKTQKTAAALVEEVVGGELHGAWDPRAGE